MAVRREADALRTLQKAKAKAEDEAHAAILHKEDFPEYMRIYCKGIFNVIHGDNRYVYDYYKREKIYNMKHLIHEFGTDYMQVFQESLAVCKELNERILDIINKVDADNRIAEKERAEAKEHNDWLESQQWWY